MRELYLPPTDAFVIVDVPKMQFLMIDGDGFPQGEPGTRALQWLVTALYPITRVAKEQMGRHFVEPPVEGLFWADDIADLAAGRKDRLKWRLMMPATPDWVTADLFEDGVRHASGTSGEPPSSLRLDTYDEGRSVQIMHVGPPADQCTTVVRMHQEFLPAHELTANGPHHEIYLTDPRRVAPAKQKTVLRQPVRRLS